MAVTTIHRPTKAIISRQAIKHNIQQEIERLSKDTELFAVVKANAYGHGLVEVAKTAKEAGATGFCVAYLDEALALRKAGITEPILVLGVLEPVNDVVLAAKNDISLTVASNDWLERAQNILQKEQLQVKIHIAIDSGMGRIGYADEKDIQYAISLLRHNEYFVIEGIFTHFATADEVDDSYFHQQQETFAKFYQMFPFDFHYIHTANTATALWHKAWHSNMIRFGIGLYGMNPSGQVIAEPYHLQPAMKLVTEIVFVKEMPKGKSISYGATYTTKSSEWIATLPIGYADGLWRRYTGFELLVDGQRCPIVGRVCMDQVMIKLPKYYPVGTEVVIIGQSQDEVNTFEMAAEHIGTINYELACAISQRVSRIYK